MTAFEPWARESDLLARIGNTPLLRLRKVVPANVPPEVEVYAKAEWFNPGGSVKDRPAYRIVRDAIAAGEFKPGQTLLDSIFGNTGVAYAMIGAALSFPVRLVVPRNANPTRREVIAAYGAQIIDSDPLEGSDGSRQVACEMARQGQGKYFYADQYSNPANWKAHYDTTGPEIWRDTHGRVTHFIAGMGTSGTMMGTARFLKAQNPRLRTIALQPESWHGIEGWKNMDTAAPVGIYDPNVHDELITVPTEPAYHWACELARTEGVLASPSAGAAFCGALQAINGLKQGVVVILFADESGTSLHTPQHA